MWWRGEGVVEGRGKGRERERGWVPPLFDDVDETRKIPDTLQVIVLSTVILHMALKLPYWAATRRTDMEKSIVALVLWPLLRELLLLRLRDGTLRLTFRARRLKHVHAPRIEVVTFGLSFYFSLLGRFMICSLSSLNAVLLVSLLQAVQEVFFRQTYYVRDKAVARYIKRLSDKEISERFDSGTGRRLKARTVIVEMLAEYCAIVVGATSIIAFADHPWLLNLG